jgi:hypothetical protein
MFCGWHGALLFTLVFIKTHDVSGAYFGTRPENFRLGKKMLSGGEQNLRGD